MLPTQPEVNFNSQEWLNFKVWLQLTLDSMRTTLERSANSPEETANLRGKIAFCRSLLSFPRLPGQD